MTSYCKYPRGIFQTNVDLTMFIKELKPVLDTNDRHRPLNTYRNYILRASIIQYNLTCFHFLFICS